MAIQKETRIIYVVSCDYPGCVRKWEQKAAPTMRVNQDGRLYDFCGEHCREIQQRSVVSVEAAENLRR